MPLKIYIVITDTGTDVAAVQEMSVWINSLLSSNLTLVLPITAEYAKLYYDPTPPSPPDYGYSYTDAAIDYLLSQRYVSNSDYIMFTNGDNLYADQFASTQLLPYMKDGIDILGFDFISRYFYSRYAFQAREEASDGTRKFALVAF